MSGFFKNLAFSAASKYLGSVIGLSIVTVLSRLITPEEFGIIGIGIVFISFLNMIGDLGLSPAVIRYKNLSKQDYESLYGFSCWIGVILSGGFFFISHIIGRIYNNGELTRICMWLSLVLLFSILNTVPQNLLISQKRFDIISRRVIIVQITTGGASIIAAYNNWGVNALILSQISTIMLTYLSNSYFSKIYPKIFLDWKPIKSIASFSLFQFLFNIVGYLGQNLDRIIISKSLNLTQLAFFDKSKNLSFQPVHNISGVVSSVVYPYLVDIFNDQLKLKKYITSILHLLLLISFPISALCITSSHELIYIIFGPQWIPAIPVFTILSIAIIVEIPHVMEGTILQVCGKTKLLFIIGLVKTFILLMMLALSTLLWGNMYAICIATVISSFIGVNFSFYCIYKYCFNSDFCILSVKYLLLPVIQFSLILGFGHLLDTTIIASDQIYVFLLKLLITVLIVVAGLEFFSPFRISQFRKILKDPHLVLSE